jgi:hypothetical protein
MTSSRAFKLRKNTVRRTKPLTLLPNPVTAGVVGRTSMNHMSMQDGMAANIPLESQSKRSDLN